MFRVARSILLLLGRLELVAAVSSLVAICGLTGTTVFMRSFFGTSILWAEEVSLLLMKVMVFFGAAAIYKARAQITVDVVFARLPPAAQRAAAVLAWLAALVFAVLVAWEAALTYPLQIVSQSYLLQWPKFYFTIPLIYGAVSIALTSLYYMMRLAMIRGETAEQAVLALTSDTTGA